MKAEIKKAVAPATARTNEQHNKAYLRTALLSSQIGQLLLFDKPNWQDFEIILREYINLKLNEVKL